MVHMSSVFRYIDTRSADHDLVKPLAAMLLVLHNIRLEQCTREECMDQLSTIMRWTSFLVRASMEQNSWSGLPSFSNGTMYSKLLT